MRFGFPVTNELLIDGRTVQYTERARFELHSENAPPYNVLLGRLGAESRRRASERETRSSAPHRSRARPFRLRPGTI